jgi:hypothetical protein
VVLKGKSGLLFNRYLEQKQIHIGKSYESSYNPNDIKNETVRKYMDSMFNVKRSKDIYNLPMAAYKVRKAQQHYEKIITKPRIASEVTFRTPQKATMSSSYGSDFFTPNKKSFL